MKLLIIGSKGFIGSHSQRYFEAKGYQVWGCDVVVDYENDKYFLVDATNSDYSELFRIHQFDACINCSGAASVPDSIKNPRRDYTLNTTNVYQILDSIRKYSPQCKFLNLGTAAVYGNPTHLPVKETQNLDPVSPYGIHKKQAEEICILFSKNYSLRTCTVRIFSAYGEGLKKQLFWDIYKKIETDADISFHGTGKETRDFIYIDDVVVALHHVLSKSKFEGESVNIGNGTETTIEYAISTLLQSLNWRGNYSFSGENRTGDPLKWCANIELLRSYGYERKVSFEEGIEKYHKWLKTL